MNSSNSDSWIIIATTEDLAAMIFELSGKILTIFNFNDFDGDPDTFSSRRRFAGAA